MHFCPISAAISEHLYIDGRLQVLSSREIGIWLMALSNKFASAASHQIWQVF
jgi:hypothetical protein